MTFLQSVLISNHFLRFRTAMVDSVKKILKKNYKVYLHKDQMVAYNISGNLYRIAIKIQTFHNEQFNAKN